METVLRINNLIVGFETEQGQLTAVKGVSLKLNRGETLALVGESGCGKTVLCKSMLKILCDKGRIEQGEILLEGIDLVPIGERELAQYRGSDIAMIFQDPMTSLDPTQAVGKQIAEVFMVHGKCSKEQAKEKAIELMRLVEIDRAEQRYNQMPHHFSGGMRQRIAIAIALAGNPKLLLADEPTTSLDAETQKQILALLKEVQKKIQIATIFITHDLSLVEGFADRVAIMQEGCIVETGTVEEVFSCPKDSYTKKLLGYLDYQRGRGHDHKDKTISERETLISVSNLKKYFPLGRNCVNKVLDGISFDIKQGEILGLIGASGSGKSTLARCIMGIYQPTEGTITYDNKRKRKNWKQMIFQDSSSAFNPRMTVGEIIGEPFKIANKKKLRPEAIRELMRQVELDPELMDRRPYDISGGQRQRVAIARALSIDPEFIIADEPISSLDISTQAQIVHLLKRLQKERGLTILFIAHDLPMVNHISDRILKLE